MPPPSAPHIDSALLEFEDVVAELARAARNLLWSMAPDSIEMVYDLYALALGYSFTNRSSDHFCHIAIYSSYLNIGFTHGADLEDSDRLLQGTGKRIRHVRVDSLTALQNPAVHRLIDEAILRAKRPESPPAESGTSILKAASTSRRRRR